MVRVASRHPGQIVTGGLIQISKNDPNRQQNVTSDVINCMSPPNTNSATANGEMRQIARRPRESDGVGNALRQVFGGGAMLSSELHSLIGQLSRYD
jgi:hypothetical protein